MSQVYLMNDSDLRLYEDISQNVDLKRLLPFIGKAQQLDLRQFMGKAFYDDFIQNFSNDNGVSGDVLLTVKATTATNGNYLNQAVAATSGSGTGATFDISVYGGYVTSVKINQPGSGYNIGDTLTFTAIPGAVLSVKELAPVVVIAGGISQAYRDLFDGKLYEDKQGHTIQYNGIIPALVYWSFARFVEADALRFTATGPVTKTHDNAQPVSDKRIIEFANQQRSTANAYANDIEEFLYNNMTDYPLWRYNQRNKNSRQPGARIRGIDRTNYNRPGYGNNNYPFGYDGLGGIL
jgi:hypothetical protein